MILQSVRKIFLILQLIERQLQLHTKEELIEVNKEQALTLYDKSLIQ